MHDAGTSKTSEFVFVCLLALHDNFRANFAALLLKISTSLLGLTSPVRSHIRFRLLSYLYALMFILSSFMAPLSCTLNKRNFHRFSSFPSTPFCAALRCAFACRSTMMLKRNHMCLIISTISLLPTCWNLWKLQRRMEGFVGASERASELCSEHRYLQHSGEDKEKMRTMGSLSFTSLLSHFILDAP